jgi:hypothetical protein
VGRICFGALALAAACGGSPAKGLESQGANPHLADPQCGQDSIALLPPAAPNLLLVLDRSGSMVALVPQDGASKWDDLVAAVGLLARRDHQLRLGLLLFPSDDWCGVAGLDVELGDAAGPAVLSALDHAWPNGRTPVAAALQAAAGYPALADPSRHSFVLLLTDGLPNCDAGGEPTLGAVRALYARGVRTIVVGFGAGAPQDPQLLTDLALAGGAARPDGAPTRYYQADQLADLEGVMRAVARSLIGCAFQLDRRPDSLGALSVRIGAQVVLPDASEGWTYDPAGPTLSFHGASCEALQDSTAGSVVVGYGCSPVP